MNFTANRCRGARGETQELSHALLATKSIVEKLILINADAGAVCMQMGHSVRVQQKVRVITPTPRGAELKVLVECSMHQPHTGQIEGKRNLNISIDRTRYTRVNSAETVFQGIFQRCTRRSV